MTKIYNFTLHDATPDQLDAGVVEIHPESKAALRKLLTFDELPDRNELWKRTMQIFAIALEECEEGATVMIGGAAYFMPWLEACFQHYDYEVVYAFTKRVCEEEQMPDGTVKKTYIFKHEGFVSGR